MRKSLTILLMLVGVLASGQKTGSSPFLRDLVRGESISTQALTTNVASQALYAGSGGVLFLLMESAEYVSFDGKTVVRFSPESEGDITSKRLVSTSSVASDGIDVYFVVAVPDQERRSPAENRFFYYLARYSLDGKYKGLTQIQHDFNFCCHIAVLGNDTILLAGTHYMREPGKDANDWNSYHEMPWIGRFGSDGGHIDQIELPGEKVPGARDGLGADYWYLTGCIMDRDEAGNIVFARVGPPNAPVAEPKAWIFRPGHDPELTRLPKPEVNVELLAIKIHDGKIAIFTRNRSDKTLQLSVYGDKGHLDRSYKGDLLETGIVVADWNPSRLLMTRSYVSANGEPHIQFVEWWQK